MIHEHRHLLDTMRAILRRVYPVPDLDEAFRETVERFAKEAGQ